MIKLILVFVTTVYCYGAISADRTIEFSEILTLGPSGRSGNLTERFILMNPGSDIFAEGYCFREKKWFSDTEKETVQIKFYSRKGVVDDSRISFIKNFIRSESTGLCSKITGAYFLNQSVKIKPGAPYSNMSHVYDFEVESLEKNSSKDDQSN